MTKLCPRGKAAAKRKFKVYPSAYANAYASKICAGKIKDPSGVKRKDFRGRKPAAMGGPMSESLKKIKDKLAEIKRDRAKVKKAEGGLMEATEKLRRQGLKGGGICKKGMNRKAVGKNS